VQALPPQVRDREQGQVRVQVAQQDSVRDFQLQEEAGLPLQLERVEAGQQPLEVAEEAVALLLKHSRLKKRQRMPQFVLLQQRALR
jgi:hypothetical protein